MKLNAHIHRIANRLLFLTLIVPFAVGLLVAAPARNWRCGWAIAGLIRLRANTVVRQIRIFVEADNRASTSSWGVWCMRSGPLSAILVVQASSLQLESLHFPGGTFQLK